MRRCPGRSFTVVGDLAQRRSEAGATSWAAMLEPYVPGRWIYRSLSVNYRTPAEIMNVAAALLAEFAPAVQPPESVRACGVQPWSRRVDEAELPSAIEEYVRTKPAVNGTSVVIGQRVCRAPWYSRDEGPGVRRRPGRGSTTHPRQRPAQRGRTYVASPAPPDALPSCTGNRAEGACRPRRIRSRPGGLGHSRYYAAPPAQQASPATAATAATARTRLQPRQRR